LHQRDGHDFRGKAARMIAARWSAAGGQSDWPFASRAPRD
jgi:hypothetical protein